jgi:phosphoribosylanthranilate isomerase
MWCGVSGLDLKVCGICDEEDLSFCAALGISFVGLNLIPESPRYLNEEEALKLWTSIPRPARTELVLVCKGSLGELNALTERWRSETSQMPIIQHHGAVLPEFTPRATKLWQAVHPKSAEDVATVMRYDVDLLLFDGPKPGTGEVFDWQLLPKNEQKPWGLAGGIRLENLADAMSRKPQLIDVCSGVELTKRKKDHAKIEHIWNNIKNFARA